MEHALLRPVRRAIADVTSVTAPVRLSGGANNETWSFDAIAGPVRHPLILRRQTGGAAGLDEPGTGPPVSIGPAREAALLAAVAQAGVPVPRVRAVLEPADALGDGFLMDRLDGETRPRRLFYDPAYATARTRMIAQCATALAALHAMPIDAAEAGLRRATPADELALWTRRWRAHDGARPVFELALRWLHAHVPPAGRPALVHGDFRTGNLLADGHGLRAVLDWELAHVGDPAFDLGWFCVASWRFGRLHAEAGGFGTREALVDAYRAAGGAVDDARVRYWEVMGTLRWGVMCLDMAQAWRSGRDRSVERVAVGRRASETELDLLRLLAPRACA